MRSAVVALGDDVESGAVHLALLRSSEPLYSFSSVPGHDEAMIDARIEFAGGGAEAWKFSISEDEFASYELLLGHLADNLTQIQPTTPLAESALETSLPIATARICDSANAAGLRLLLSAVGGDFMNAYAQGRSPVTGQVGRCFDGSWPSRLNLVSCWW